MPRNLKATVAEEILFQYGFATAEPTEGRSSVADLFKPDRRCGVYVLHFATGELYVGQSVNVVRRYAEHLKAHPDIAALGFKELSSEELDASEQELIQVLERGGQRLRNVTFSALPPTESDFDLVMSPSEQELWLEHPDSVDTSGKRIKNEHLRQKYSPRFKKFTTIDNVSSIVAGASKYLRAAIPAIKRGEVSFWAVSCLPAYPNRNIILFLRINLNWQEVFTVFRDKATGVDFFSFHLAKSPLEEHYGPRLSELQNCFPGIEIANHTYVPGGHDQINLIVAGSQLASFLETPEVRDAIRQFNLRLMRKGACMYSKNHCLDLADLLLDRG